MNSRSRYRCWYSCVNTPMYHCCIHRLLWIWITMRAINYKRATHLSTIVYEPQIIFVHDNVIISNNSVDIEWTFKKKWNFTFKIAYEFQKNKKYVLELQRGKRLILSTINYFLCKRKLYKRMYKYNIVWGVIIKHSWVELINVKNVKIKILLIIARHYCM